MDIKTRLENDNVLFGKYDAETRGKRIHYLNSIGIYTIEDFINCKESDFSKYSSRELYWAMSHIFRHEYLGEDIIYDALLENKYHSNRDGVRLCYSDMAKMGIMDTHCKRDAVREIWYALDKHNYRENNIFDIEWVIKNVNPAYFNGVISFYYLDYIEKQKKDKQPSSILDSSSELNNLKIQLQTLISINKLLQEQIDELQEQVTKLEGGQSVHGK